MAILAMSGKGIRSETTCPAGCWTIEWAQFVTRLCIQSKQALGQFNTWWQCASTSPKVPGRVRRSVATRILDTIELSQPELGRPGRLVGTLELVIPDTPLFRDRPLSHWRRVLAVVVAALSVLGPWTRGHCNPQFPYPSLRARTQRSFGAHSEHSSPSCLREPWFRTANPQALSSSCVQPCGRFVPILQNLRSHNSA